MRTTAGFAIALLLSACTMLTPGSPGASPVETPIQPTAAQPQPTQAPLPTPAPTLTATIPDPASLRWTLVVNGLQRPVALTSAGDDRLFIVEQRGLIQIFSGGGLLPEPFLDLQDFVTDKGSEQGLLGLAFHPNYLENGRFFVNYTDIFGNTVVARFEVSADPNRANLDSLRVILRAEQPYPNHNGGGLAFGPDSKLYIGLGDGGAADDPLGNGQKLDTLLGKLLRIDVDQADPYAIPSDNPSLGEDTLPEIWAFGLRNPWRFTFDRKTGDLYLGDVGQDQWEEVDFLPAGSVGGANFGWNLMEGSHPSAGEPAPHLITPIAEYAHDQGCSVTGGVVMRDPSLPAWDGVYLYGDYCNGTIWGLLRNPDGTWQNFPLFNTASLISSFGEGHDGGVYLVDLEGAIYRLEPAP